MSKYIGVQPTQTEVTARTVDIQTAGINQTVYDTPYTVGGLDIYINGILQNPASFTAVDGTTVTLADSPTPGDTLVFIKYAAVRQLYNAQTVTVTGSVPSVNNSSNLGFDIGSRWVNTLTGEDYVCTDATPGAAVWVNTTKSASVFL